MSELTNINYAPLAVKQSMVKNLLFNIQKIVDLSRRYNRYAYMANDPKHRIDEAWRNFASANAWPLNPTHLQQEFIPPSLNFTPMFHMSSVISAQVSGILFDFFLFESQSSSLNMQLARRYTVARVMLPVALPHILLLDKKADIKLNRDMQNGRQLQLEGNFSQVFSLQLEQGQEINALTVITPDIMQTIMTFAVSEDIEIFGNHMFFIIGGYENTIVAVQAMLRSIDMLASQLIRNCRLG